MGCELARVSLGAAALFPQGIVAPQSRVRGRLGLCFWRWRCGRKCLSGAGLCAGMGCRGGLREGGEFAVLAAGGNDRAAVGMG